MKLPEWISEFSSELTALKEVGRRLAWGLVALAALAYPLSGIYVVGVNETGVLKRFGKVIEGSVMPGLHYKLPWPIDDVARVSTGEIHRLQAGFGADLDDVVQYEQTFGRVTEIQYGSFIVPYCITGDKNIIHTKVIAQYRISDPNAYLYGCEDAEAVTIRCIQSGIVRALSRTDVDSALMTGRIELQQQILSDVREQLEPLRTGITVFSTEIKKTRPPSSVAQSFKDVINAREERRAMVHTAHAYRNEAIPEGNAEASRILEEAKAYGTRKKAQAEGDSRRFVMLAEEYLKDRKTTAQRLYLDAMCEVLPSVQKVIVGCEEGQDVAVLKFFAPGRNGTSQ